MKNVYISDNAIAAHALTQLRDKNTSTERFRFYSDQICQILIDQSLQQVQLESIAIETPLTGFEGKKLPDDIVIVPILRAGIAMLNSALHMLPHAKVGFAGLQRDEATAIAKEYYWKFPQITQDSIVIITDPMLATGGSLLHVLKRLKEYTPKEIRIVSVISAPEGIGAIHKEFPEVTIFTAAVDQQLNAQKYIVPGLGDYGDRYFGTE